MSRFYAAVLAGLAVFGLSAELFGAAAQGRIVASHGDWQIRCEQPVGSPSEQCALVQNVEAEDRANVGLTVIFLRTADRQARILRVLAPLGVLLPSGLGLSIDDNEVGLAGFVRCLPEGCIAEVELDDGLLERFGAGTTATFVIFQTPEEGIGIPISLNGFSDGFAALDDPPPPLAEADLTPAAPREAVPTTVEPGPGAGAPVRAFEIEGDDRSDLEVLLEDPMLPYAAAGLVLILAVVIVLILIMRGRSRRNAAAPVAESRRAPPAPPPAADGLETLETGAAPVADRTGPRLAPKAPPRQLPNGTDSAPRAPRSPALPRAPRGS